MKDSIPANNLLHTFPEGDIARSLQIPVPSFELDFRMSIKLHPKVSIGPCLWGQREWMSFVGGQWAGRWGKGIILVGHVLLLELPVVRIKKIDNNPSSSSLVAKIRKWL
jgi:hypothetical protein